jgi:hypothetical protein
LETQWRRRNHNLETTVAPVVIAGIVITILPTLVLVLIQFWKGIGRLQKGRQVSVTDDDLWHYHKHFEVWQIFCNLQKKFNLQVSYILLSLFLVNVNNLFVRFLSAFLWSSVARVTGNVTLPGAH